ncbi:MAG TPA: SDR family NAD(P)-dependent oxidoreductase [Enhygromyxa sp.]|nr:SDR family NAD(P)-dependent oxidoreductase [Enhygromyxa sp.]
MSSPSSKSRWRDRVALVTGASSGIGRAIAKRLAVELGMRTVICARRAERLHELRDEILAADADAELLVHPCDLRDEAAILAMFAAIRERFGGVDVLINNAGLGRDAPLCSGATEHWREMLELNVLALCICTREAVTDMRRRGDDGHVIHVASMASHRVPPGSGVYSASKYAVRSLIEGLRLELRALDSDIRVGAISPGFVETEFAQNYAHGDPEASKRTYARFKVLTADDVASTVVHMLEAPAHVQIHDVLMRATRQPS